MASPNERTSAQSRSRTIGLEPGALVYVGDRETQATQLSVLSYDASHVTELQPSEVEECAQLRDSATVTWVNVAGLSDVGLVESLGKVFGLHPLVLEDILDTEQRPKVEDYGDYLYVVVRMLSHEPDRRPLGSREGRTPGPGGAGESDGHQGYVRSEQASLILGRGFVLCFVEDGGDVFDPVRHRVRTGTGRLRRSGADFLLYSILDAVVDNYFATIEVLGELIEDIEEAITARPSPTSLRAVHGLRRELLVLRKAIWPLREVLNRLDRGETELIADETEAYLRDVYDHTVEVMDTVETQREILGELVELHLSSTSNRLGEVVKVLTVISTIFMPLTFIAGIYGMNFDTMPELRTPLGYPAVLLLMVAIAGYMLYQFRRKGWI